MNNSDTLDTALDDLVFKHEKYDKSAFCCLRDASIREALNTLLQEANKERDSVWTKRDEYWKWYIIEHAKEYPDMTLKEFVQNQFVMQPSGELQADTKEKRSCEDVHPDLDTDHGGHD